MVGKKADSVPCMICGNPTRMIGTQLCDPCWECTRRLPRFLDKEAGRQYVKVMLESYERGNGGVSG